MSSALPIRACIQVQTAGRGRSGRNWSSGAKGNNLQFTLLSKPKKLEELYKLNLSAAMAIAKTARGFGKAFDEHLFDVISVFQRRMIVLQVFQLW